jgi:6-phosphogluconolactonase
MFKELARPKRCLGIPWASVHLYWVDERCVPQTDPESNFGNAWNLCLKYVPVPRGNVHRIPGEEEPERACRLYAQLLQQHLPKTAEGLPCFDWVFLGVGSDGHTASLFPGRPVESDGPCLVASQPETGQSRISLTLPVIKAAKRITFMVTGSDKAAVLAGILGESESRLPAARVSGSCVEWWCDAAAACQWNET